MEIDVELVNEYYPGVELGRDEWTTCTEIAVTAVFLATKGK